MLISLTAKRQTSMRRSLVAVLLSASFLAGCDNQRVHELYTGPEAQAVSLQANDTVLVTHIDAVEQDTAFIGQKHTYRLAPGKHTLLVEYAALFQLDADRHEKLTSPPIKVTFEAQPGKAYLFRHAEQATVDAARTFAKAPKLELISVPDHSLVAATFEQSLPMSFLPQIRFENTESYGFASDRVEQAGAAAASTKPVTNALPAVAPGASVTPTEQAQTLDTMKALWQKASPDQRRAFQEWVKAQ